MKNLNNIKSLFNEAFLLLVYLCIITRQSCMYSLENIIKNRIIPSNPWLSHEIPLHFKLYNLQIRLLATVMDKL